MAGAADVFAWTQAWARAAGLKLWHAEETGSTNSVAKDDESHHTKPALTNTFAACSAPSLYMAARQTQGRGRGSHTWTTPSGASLLSSWSFAMRSVPQPILSPLVGLALFEAAAATWSEVEFNLKAPNDLYIGRLKTAGLLIETVDSGLERRTVVGLGLNVTGKPSDVPTATCVAEHLGREATEEEWHRFLTEWQRRLMHAMEAGQSQRLTPETADRLKGALNRHPLLKEPILRVDELGQLHSASRIIHWHEL